MTTLALRSTTLDHLPPFDQAIYGYLARCKCEATLRAYQEDLKNYLGWCQSQQLDPLTAKRAHLDVYVRWMQAQNRWSESTISRRIGTVCGLYKYACIEEYIPKDPGAGVMRPGVDRAKQHRTYLNPVEYAQLVKAARTAGPTEHALVTLLGMMGLRIGEACSLNVENVSTDSGYRILSFIGKGNKAARTPVPIPVMRALDDVIGTRDTGPILLNQDGNRMDRAAAARILRRLAKQAGIDNDVTPHGLRRTFVTSGLLSKIPIYEMQVAARHVSPSTTALYDMARQSLDRNATHQGRRVPCEHDRMIERAPCTDPIEVQSEIRYPRAHCRACGWSHTLHRTRPLLNYSSDSGERQDWDKTTAYSSQELQQIHDRAARLTWRKEREHLDSGRLPKHLRPND